MQTVTQEQFSKDYYLMDNKKLAIKYDVSMTTINNWIKKLKLKRKPQGRKSKLIMSKNI